MTVYRPTGHLTIVFFFACSEVKTGSGYPVAITRVAGS